MITIAEVVKQNTGLDPGLRAQGGLDSWDWMTHGWPATGTKRPPATATSITGYGHMYAERGKPYVPCNVIIANHKTYVHKKGGGWIKVQDQADQKASHGYWKGDYTVVRPAIPVVRQSDGTDKFPAPNYGDIEHFWHGLRGQYAAGTIDGAFTLFDAKIDNAAGNFIISAGIDWWSTPSAAFVAPPGTNNPAYSMSSWVKLGTEYKPICSTDLTEAQLRADPPPSVVLSDVEPPIEPEPESKITFSLNGKPLVAGDVLTIKV